MKPIALAVLAVATAVLALAGIGRPGEARSASAEPNRSITVTGAGSVKAIPDVARFSFGVSSDAVTGAAALAANASKMQDVIAALDRLGVAPADIQTEDASVSPNWTPSGAHSGYTARNSVSVAVRKIARAGAIADGVTAAGATNVSGPSFERAGQHELYAKALREAVADARRKAGTLAAAAGVAVGAVTRVEEAQAVGMPDRGLSLRAAQSANPTPIVPGTQEVQATVIVSYSIG